VPFRNGAVPERRPASGEQAAVTTGARTAADATCPDDAVGPRLGRPRDPSLDLAILRSTLDLLAEGGYAAVTMEAVATRAGVGKATLYRRHPGKEQLVVDALASLAEPVEPAEGAGVRDQLVALLEGLQRRSGSLAGRIFPRLISEAVDNPELMHRYRQQVMEPRRARFRAVLRDGVEQGVVRADVDLDHAVDLLVGAVAYRNLLRPDPPVGPGFPARVVDDLLHGLTPRPTAPEPT
jgi:AcrR family transcriptional regulator